MKSQTTCAFVKIYKICGRGFVYVLVACQRERTKTDGSGLAGPGRLLESSEVCGPCSRVPL